jgi:neutral ceramidase
MKRFDIRFLIFSFSVLFAPAELVAQDKVFKAGAATSTITPKIGTSVNGNLNDVKATHIHDDTYSRALVLDDGDNKLAFVVSDLCMISREVIDAAKKRAYEVTKIPVQNMVMSATHTHSGGTVCSVFQSDPDPEYVKFVTERMADALIRANNNLVPARIGWGVGKEPSQVFNRRWKIKPGTKSVSPLGKEDKVRMNPGHLNLDVTEPAGPVDPEVPIVIVQTLEGAPIGLLANYSLHYVGGTGPGEVSADYYGMFANRMQKLLGVNDQAKPFVAMMTNGTSGNINNINFGAEAPKGLSPYEKMGIVGNTVAAEAFKVYQTIKFQNWVSLASVQKELTLGVRKPAKEEVTKAKAVLAKVDKSLLRGLEEIYARETVLLNEYPNQVPLIIQAFRIGDLAIAQIPCEVFVEIGLGIKANSPFKPTFTISLANGYNGYLPTPEHHELGGYETWRARSSYLEVTAATKISETVMELLNTLK